MKRIHEIRQQGLRELISKDFAGKQKSLSEKTGISPSLLGQYLSGHRNLGEDNARKIEHLAGKRPGWLDIDHTGSNVSPAPIGMRPIPIINYIQAGMWTDIADNFFQVDDSNCLLTDLELSTRAFGLEIKGDSMLPDFRPGDRIIVDPEIFPSPGDFVVAKNGSDEATFKKYRPRGINERGEQVFELVPLNPDYETMRSDCVHIIILGTMIEHRRYRKR